MHVCQHKLTSVPPSLSASTHSSPSSIWLTSDALVSFFSTSALHHSLPAHPVGGCASGVWLWKCEVNRRWASGVVFSKRSIYHMISRVKRERHIQSKNKIQLQWIKNKRLVWCDNTDISWHAAYFAANYTVSLFYFVPLCTCRQLMPISLPVWLCYLHLHNEHQHICKYFKQAGRQTVGHCYKDGWWEGVAAGWDIGWNLAKMLFIFLNTLSF